MRLNSRNSFKPPCPAMAPAPVAVATAPNAAPTNANEVHRKDTRGAFVHRSTSPGLIGSLTARQPPYVIAACRGRANCEPLCLLQLPQTLLWSKTIKLFEFNIALLR